MLELLRAAFAVSPLTVTPEQTMQMANFYALLMEANQKMNLTAIQSEAEAVMLHFLDSASPLFFGYINDRDKCCDVGSGAGFPGMVLALLKPDCEFVLMDSLQKRVKFLTEAAKALNLNNVTALHSRAEDAGIDPKHRENYNVVLSRAVAPLPVLCEYCLPLLRIGGRMIAFKGPNAAEELSGAQRALKLLGAGTASVMDAGIPERSHTLICIEKKYPTPKTYPRKAGMPAKQPL